MEKLKVCVAGIVMFAPQIILVVLNKSWQVMGIFLICSVLVCILFLQDKINNLKLGKDGIELDMKRAINEAYATIDNIKEMADPIINFNLQLMAGEDLAFDGTSSEERIAFLKKIRKLSEKLEIDTPELRNSFAKAKHSVLYAFSSEIYSLWGSDSSSYRISNEIIKLENGSSEVNLDKFKSCINELDSDRRIEAEKLYESLVEFLDETKDVNDTYY